MLIISLQQAVSFASFSWKKRKTPQNYFIHIDTNVQYSRAYLFEYQYIQLPVLPAVLHQAFLNDGFQVVVR